MRQELETEHWEELASQCRLVPGHQRDREFAMPASALLDERTCRELMDNLTPILGSPHHYVTASLLAKRIAFLTTGTALYALSALNRGLDLSIGNCYLEYRHQDGLWQSHMPLSETTTCVPAPGHRDQLREQVISHLFAGHLTPLWNRFRAVTRVPLPVLWENTAVRVYSLYEKRLSGQDCPVRQQRIDDDFHYLIHQAPAELFGLGYNPLHRYFHTQRCDPTAGTRIRKTCCYYYRATDPAKYCSTCPLPQAARTS